MSTQKDSKGFSLGVGLSIFFHVILIGYLISVVKPISKDVPIKRKMPDVVLQISPPPPPPPPPDKPPPPKTPPKPTPPVPRPTPIKTQAPQDVPTPTAAPAPPPEPPAPPAPSAPPAPTGLVTGATWPASYLRGMESAVKAHYQYPPKAAREGQEGQVLVHIKMLRDGTIVEATVKEKSGFLELDKEAKDVLMRIGKFPPVPESAYPGVAAFEFDLPINATLSE